MQVEDVGVAAGPEEHRLIDSGQLVRIGFEPCTQSAKVCAVPFTNAAVASGERSMRAAVRGAQLRSPADALDGHEGRRFALTVENGVAHQRHRGIRRHRQPIARLPVAADEHLEGAIRG